MRIFLLTVLALGLTGCQSTPDPASAKRVIGVVPKGANHIFWQTVYAGAIKAAQESGFEIEWNAPTLEVDSSRQIEIVESMVNRRLAGIVLAPVDRKALVGVVERAAQAGIPVAIFDSSIDTDKRITYVATDNEEGGRIAARRLAAAIGGRGKVGIVSFMPGSASTEQRSHGFQDEIRQKFPDINIVGLQYGMADRAKAMAVTENILTAHPDLAGLFADNESSSSGAVQALKTRKAARVKLVAFDHAQNLIDDLRAGHIDALIVQNPFKMGYESTRAIGLKLKGQSPAATIDSGLALIRKSDLDQPSIQELIAPDLRKYLP